MPAVTASPKVAPDTRDAMPLSALRTDNHRGLLFGSAATPAATLSCTYRKRFSGPRAIESMCLTADLCNAVSSCSAASCIAAASFSGVAAFTQSAIRSSSASTICSRVVFFTVSTSGRREGRGRVVHELTATALQGVDISPSDNQHSASTAPSISSDGWVVSGRSQRSISAGWTGSLAVSGSPD